MPGVGEGTVAVWVGGGVDGGEDGTDGGGARDREDGITVVDRCNGDGVDSDGFGKALQVGVGDNNTNGLSFFCRGEGKGGTRADGGPCRAGQRLPGIGEGAVTVGVCGGDDGGEDGADGTGS